MFANAEALDDLLENLPVAPLLLEELSAPQESNGNPNALGHRAGRPGGRPGRAVDLRRLTSSKRNRLNFALNLHFV